MQNRPGETGPTSDQGAFAAVPRVELPRGGGALRGIGEKFSVEPSKGTAVVAVPIRCTPARAGMSPQLTLAYDSGAGSGPFGLGWHLSLPAIVRRTDRGVPRYDDDDAFVLSGTDDLVRVPGPALRRDDGRGAAFDVDRFRPRIEGLFARIERWRDTASGDVHWRSISRDGITTRYGTGFGHRVTDPDDPSHTSAWLIASSIDPLGNAIAYEYADDGAQRYIRSIRYGNRSPAASSAGLEPAGDAWMFEVRFDYDEDSLVVTDPDPDTLPTATLALADQPRWAMRPDPFSSRRSGFEIRTDRRCRRILMLHRFPDLGPGPCLVGSTDFDYADFDVDAPREGLSRIAAELRHPGSTRFSSKLVGVVAAGYRRIAPESDTYIRGALPPVTFGYSAIDIDGQVHDLPPESAAHLPEGLAAPAQWVDLDGDAAAGVLVESEGVWLFAANRGDGAIGPSRVVRSIPNMTARGDARPQLLDLAGDGSVDLAFLGGDAPGFFERTADGWSGLRPFDEVPQVDWGSPHVELVDLTGDGLADVVDADGAAPRWYRSRGEAGFRYGGGVSISDGSGWPRPDPGGDELLLFADMSGDGMPDLVRVRRTGITYWPNTGNGRFAPAVTMSGSPALDQLGRFDPARVRLADVDGSGTTDLIYLHRDGPVICFNHAGRAWSDPVLLPPLPDSTPLASVQVVDLLGHGACLVWSSRLPGDSGRHVRYVDLAASGKPHLLTHVDNALGAVTAIEYAASTRFALADREAGRPWATRLPFPVFVVCATRTVDAISGCTTVSRYAYHEGHFDGDEREFRGFGLVERWDAEDYDGVGDDRGRADAPPALTRTWFHTGRDVADTELTRTAWPTPAGLATPDRTLLPAGLTPAERRDACRALKGRTLREEVYGKDGTEREGIPYVVTDQSWAVRVLQRRGDDATPGVYLAHPSQELARHYERDVSDPRTRHTASLEVDDYGNVGTLIGIGYGRRTSDPALRADQQAAQERTIVSCTHNEVTSAVDEPDAYRTPLAAASTTFEVTGLRGSAARPASLDEIRRALAEATMLDPRERVITLYRRDDLTGPLPHRALQPLALPWSTYRLALPDDVAEDVFAGLVDDELLDRAGYVRLPGESGWWMPGARVHYSPGADDDAPTELEHARGHFFLPHRFRSPFHTAARPAESLVRYDEDLLVLEVCDAAGNLTTAGVREPDGSLREVCLDHRVMAPTTVMDANRNLSHVCHDARGLVVATAAAGSPENDPSGDRVDDIEPDLTERQTAEFFDDPVTAAAELLGGASTRLVYDLASWRTSARPVVCATLARERHVLDGASPIQVRLHYSDGNGRESQRKVLSEADPLDPAGRARWLGTGWNILNSKGAAVRRFEPFFSTTHRFESEPVHGISVLLCHDPLGRVVGTVEADGSWTKVRLHAWGRDEWDAVDTLSLDPATDPDLAWWFQRLDPAERPGWLAPRLAGEHGLAERDAAVKSLALAGTPRTTQGDALGRAVAHVDRLAPDHSLYTTTRRDLQGRAIGLVDPLGREVQRSTYARTGGLLRAESMDAGTRWMLPDILGDSFVTFDQRGHRIRTERDALRRPVRTWLRVGDNPEVLVNRIRYGEDAPDPERANLRGQRWRTWDQSGLTVATRYDLSGNLERTRRRLAREYREIVDWSANVRLDSRRFVGTSRFDALGRPVEMREPDGTRLTSTYNVGGLLESLHVQGPGEEALTTVVERMDYDAHGRRTLAAYGNGTVTTWQLDPLSFRVAGIRTTRAAGRNRLVQDLRLAYDPVGNPTSIQDGAEPAVVHDGSRADAGADYTYDALYRLVRATGRELLGATERTWAGDGPRPRNHPADLRAVAGYVERYAYDDGGNLTELRHRQSTRRGAAWVRRFDASEPSRLEPDRFGDRLTRVVSGGVEEILSVDGDGYDPHGGMLRIPGLEESVWDYAGRLRLTRRERGPRPERTWYVYDAGGARVRKVTERDGRIVHERMYIGSYEEERRYGTEPAVYTTVDVMDDQRAVASLIRRVEGSGRGAARLLRHRIVDHLGSVVAELDDTGRFVSREEYTPYGSSTYRGIRRGEAPSRYRFTGKERDEESGLGYHGARYYAPQLCRWTTADPSGTVDGTNLYAYVRGRPTRAVDPTGTQSANDIGMAMMWDQMGRELSGMWESVFGGHAYVNPRANIVSYEPPQGGVGGGVGGVIRAVTLRITPIERNPTEASLIGLEMGAGLVPIADPGARLVTGTTVTGLETSRGWAAAEFGLDVVPFLFELRAMRVASSEARALRTADRLVSEADSLAHIGSTETRMRRPTTTNPTCRGDLCVADVGAHEANLRRPATETPLTNLDIVRASGRDVSVVEAPISSTGEAASFLDSAYEGLVREGRMTERIRPQIPPGPPEPGRYVAVVDGPQGGHAIHATVTEEITGQQFIAEGRLVTREMALELADDGVRVTSRTTYRTEFYDPQNGVCLADPGRVQGWIRLE